MTDPVIRSPQTVSRLDGKCVLIIGGTSGIGLATATLAAAAGAQVVVTGRDAVSARAVAKEHGFTAGVGFDVTDPRAILPALSDVGNVDHLVLLSGSFVAGEVMSADVAYLQRAFDERLWAAVHVLRALGPRLCRTGSVTLISGVLADRPTSGTALLAAASAAMEAFARGLAIELAPLRVNALSPGTIDTPLLERALGANRDAFVASVAGRLPVRRVGAPEDAAAAVMLLMTNGYISGEVLHIDGGARLV